MAENITVNDVTEEINVSDVTEQINVTVTEETISVNTGGDSVTVTTPSETVAVTTVSETVSVTDEVITIQPAVGEVVIVQPIEDSDLKFANRVDFVGDTIIYRGEAAVGSIDSAASWRISRLTIGVDDDVTEEWASGTAAFDKIWDNRAGFTYT